MNYFKFSSLFFFVLVYFNCQNLPFLTHSCFVKTVSLIVPSQFPHCKNNPFDRSCRHWRRQQLVSVWLNVMFFCWGRIVYKQMLGQLHSPYYAHVNIVHANIRNMIVWEYYTMSTYIMWTKPYVNTHYMLPWYVCITYTTVCLDIIENCFTLSSNIQCVHTVYCMSYVYLTFCIQIPHILYFCIYIQ